MICIPILDRSFPLPQKSKTWLLSLFAVTSLGLIAQSAQEKGPGLVTPFHTVVIDPGHGGKVDPGAVLNGLTEADLNLRVALLVETKLKAAGVPKIVLTRRNDTFLELDERAKIATATAHPIFLSIHHNASGNAAMSGTEVYYLSPQSLNLANAVAKELKPLRPNFRAPRKAAFGLLKSATCPTVSMEGGYLTNPEEFATITTEAYAQKYASAIVRAILAYGRGPKVE